MHSPWIENHTVDKYYKLHGYPPGFCGKGRKSWQSSQVNQVSSMQTQSNEAASQFASPRQFSAPRSSQSSCQELMAFLNAQAKIGNFQPENSSTAANLLIKSPLKAIILFRTCQVFQKI